MTSPDGASATNNAASASPPSMVRRQISAPEAAASLTTAKSSIVLEPSEPATTRSPAASTAMSYGSSTAKDEELPGTATRHATPPSAAARRATQNCDSAVTSNP